MSQQPAARGRGRQQQFRLGDGYHMPHNIALYAFGIGMVAGVGACTVALSPAPWLWLGLHLTALALFHITEYLVTAMYNYPKLELSSFLIPHSTAYMVANGLALAEFVTEAVFAPWIQQSIPIWIRLLGIGLLVVGQTARTLAMVHASTNFSHMIEYVKRPSHTLVTTGIYAYLRHPSYFGFFWWGIGSQLLLGNPLSLVSYALALGKFFRDRISFEERILIEFFGPTYEAYRARTAVRIPFVG
ncbi:Isoprenylcysteine carboxyl methyltransferase family-domain-containing protein [Blastocladiella britannica]|nr:Isoprenylcysteine carboxyl methyltransferase family-domain-containing protein [Blastocladiella britannica]